MLTNEVPERSADPPSGPPQRRRRRWQIAGIVTLVVLIAFGAVTVRLFVWPARGMPARVDAIVIWTAPATGCTRRRHWPGSTGPGTLVVSRGSPVYGHGSSCAAQIPGVRVICFEPAPGHHPG